MAAVGGRTVTPAGRGPARTVSVPISRTSGGEEGPRWVVINNVAFRREVLMAHPFEARIRREEGDTVFHQLAPRARAC